MGPYFIIGLFVIFAVGPAWLMAAYFYRKSQGLEKAITVLTKNAETAIQMFSQRVVTIKAEFDALQQAFEIAKKRQLIIEESATNAMPLSLEMQQLIEEAVPIVAEIDQSAAPGTSGVFKQNFVASKLIKAHPQIALDEIMTAVELALRKVKEKWLPKAV